MRLLDKSPLALAALLAVAFIPAIASGQPCYGTPRRGGLAFERGNISFGHTTGVGAAIAGSRVGLGLNYRHIEQGAHTTGNGGLARLAIVLGGSHLQVCPGLSVDYERSTWESVQSGTLTSNQLTGRAGLGLGAELPVIGGLSVIPFAVGQFAFRVVEFQLDAPNVNPQLSGDTLSKGDVEYGLLARYRFIYGGAIGNHFAQSGGPYAFRFVIGLTFSSGRREP